MFTECQNGEYDLSDLDHGMLVSAIWTALSISESPAISGLH